MKKVDFLSMKMIEEYKKLSNDNSFVDVFLLDDIVNGMTGAQIKELSLASISYASSKNKKINLDVIKEIKNILSEGLLEAYNYADNTSISNMEVKKVIDFGFN